MQTLLKNLGHLGSTFLNILVVAWAVATATFLLMRAVPGGPLSRERELPTAVQAAIEAKYGLDDPVYVQYSKYLVDAVRGRFGLSYDHPGRTVGQIIAQRLPVSLKLGGAAMLIALVLSFPLGIAAALGRHRWPDRLNAFVSTAGISVPSFILATFLLYVFITKLGWFRTGFRDARSIILPAVALSLMPMAYMARLIRSELLEILQSDFLRTARAKGLGMLRITIVHALRHIFAPLLAYLGPQTAAIMTGSFVVEQIFDIPGLGDQFVKSIANRNYPMIMGVTLVYAVLLVAFTLLADEVARMLDPRLRERKS